MEELLVETVADINQSLPTVIHLNIGFRSGEIGQSQLQLNYRIQKEEGRYKRGSFSCIL